MNVSQQATPTISHEICQSLIDKHTLINKLCWFPDVTTLIATVTNEDSGWECLLMGHTESDAKESLEKVLQELFLKNFADGVQYHRRICGSPSFKGIPLLGPNCSLENGCGVASDYTVELTFEEAHVLKLLFDRTYDQTLWVNLYKPYTAEHLYDLVVE